MGIHQASRIPVVLCPFPSHASGWMAELPASLAHSSRRFLRDYPWHVSHDLPHDLPHTGPWSPSSMPPVSSRELREMLINAPGAEGTRGPPQHSAAHSVWGFPARLRPHTGGAWGPGRDHQGLVGKAADEAQRIEPCMSLLPCAAGHFKLWLRVSAAFLKWLQ